LTIQNKQAFEYKEAKETKTNLETSILRANNRASDLIFEVMKELSAFQPMSQPFAYDCLCEEGSMRFRISGAPKSAGGRWCTDELVPGSAIHSATEGMQHKK